MQPSGPFPWDGQKLSVSFHNVYPPGQVSVTVNHQGAPLGVADQGLFSLAEHPHQGDHVFAGQVELGNTCCVGDGVPVDSEVTEGFTHAFLLDEGRQDLFVAVDDVLDSGGWRNEQGMFLHCYYRGDEEYLVITDTDSW